MRILFLIAAGGCLLAGCQAMSDKIDASRQDRCQRADWKLVGERDGVAGTRTMADRYEYICGDLYNSKAYQEGFQVGLMRKPPAPGM
jgi:hypothetical protein